MIEPFVVGPVKTKNGCEFAVRRLFFNKEAKKYFSLKFRIVHDERSNKWLHYDLVRFQKDSLCLERHYAPTKDCACIIACKEKLKCQKKKV